jgi:serine/threonine protein kinase
LLFFLLSSGVTVIDPLVGQTVSHYKVLDQIGGGGMGLVYRAQDLKLDRHVALKFLPPELTRDPNARQQFRHEAKAASALQHSNICTIHDIDESTDGRIFIVMDLYDGETLNRRIERRLIPLDDALDLLEKACEEHDTWVYTFKIDPMWDRLRGHPRFEALLATMNSPASADEPY